jgi:hypothetical protein
MTQQSRTHRERAAARRVMDAARSAVTDKVCPGRQGRPRKAIDWQLAEALLRLQATDEEVAGALGASVDTLARRRRFAELKAGARAHGRLSLRRVLFGFARGVLADPTTGKPQPVPMSLQLDAAKTLARHYLGITDHGSVDVTSGGQPLEGNVLIVDVGKKPITAKEVSRG